MRQITPVIVWIGLGIVSSLVDAEEFPKHSLIYRKSWTQFDLILGRITAMNPRYSQTNTVSDGSSKEGLRESLSLQVNDGVPSLHYELVSKRYQVTLEVIDGNHVRMHQHPMQSDGVRVTYEQPPEGAITLGVESPQLQRQLKARNLWELLLAEPKVCDAHLRPLLKLIRPNWQLDRRANRVEVALFRAARSGLSPDRARLDQLVVELGSPKFSTRQSADRKLRANGQILLAYLQDLDRSELDGEQKRRIRGIRRDLIRSSSDTPERVAMWLVDSPSVWLILMANDDVKDRQFAAHQLSKITNKQISFNPIATKQERQAAINELRAQLAVNQGR